MAKKKRKPGEAPTEFYDARALNPAPPTKRKRKANPAKRTARPEVDRLGNPLYRVERVSTGRASRVKSRSAKAAAAAVAKKTFKGSKVEFSHDNAPEYGGGKSYHVRDRKGTLRTTLHVKEQTKKKKAAKKSRKHNPAPVRAMNDARTLALAARLLGDD